MRRFMITMTDEQVETAISEMVHEANWHNEEKREKVTAAEALNMALCVDVEEVVEQVEEPCEKYCAMLRELWDDLKGNWTYGSKGGGADEGPTPAGWVISSESGLVGKLRRLLDEMYEEGR